MILSCPPVGTKSTKESAVFSVDTVVIVAGGFGFAFAMLGWLAGHRISLAMPPEVSTRGMVPLLVGLAGLFLGSGVGLLLGEFRTVKETTTTNPDDPDGGPAMRVTEALKTVTPARVVLAVGVLMLLAAVWLVRPPETVERHLPAGSTTTVVETGTVTPTALPTVTTTG